MNVGIEKNFNRMSLISFVLPTVVMMIVMALYTIVDGIFVSRLVGSNALSAINITLPAMNLIYGIAIMFATGASAIVAKNMGEQKIEKARSRFTFIFYVTLLISIFIGGIGLIFLDKINQFLGATPQLREYANDYLKVLLIFAPVAMVKTNFDYFIVVAGKPKLALIITLIGGMTNIVLDYLFIGPLQMGISGAALATGIGQLIPAIIGIIFFINKKNILCFTKPSLDFNMLRKSMTNGSSEMVTNLSNGVMTFLFNMTMIRYLGEDGVAAITVILYAQYLLIAGYLGFTSGVAPIISFKYGNQDREQLKKIIRYCYEMVMSWSITTFILAYIIAPYIVGAFVSSDNTVYTIATDGFYLFAISFLFTGVNIFTSGMFTAFSNGRVSALISFLRTFIFIVIGIVALPLILGVNGIWLTIPFSEVLTIVVAVYYFKKHGKVYGYIKQY